MREPRQELGVLGPQTEAALCVHLSNGDIVTLAATGTHVSYNPGSNAKLSAGGGDSGGGSEYRDRRRCVGVP